MCYLENTNVICLINGTEEYVQISDITKNMLIKTYKQGYKRVIKIRSFLHSQTDTTNPLECLYKLKNGDLTITGGHCMLVDDLTELEKITQKKLNFKNNIEDKKMLIVCLSDEFEKINLLGSIKLYHIVLENDDLEGQYGIYVNNNILSETTSINFFNWFFKNNPNIF